MLCLKIVTYIPELINKVDIESLTLLTKDGKRISVLTSSDMRSADAISQADTSRRTFVIDQPYIGGRNDYDENEIMDMLEGASILYGDITYNGDTLFADEVWIEEFSMRNGERYAQIERAIPRNFWNSAFKWFKNEQRSGIRDFERCLKQAMDAYVDHDVEAEPSKYDTDDMERVARAIIQDVWDGYDRWTAAGNL